MPQSWLDSGLATPADLTMCRDLLCGGSRSFYAASFLLPRQVHEPATALYAFCRLADDEIDMDDGIGSDALDRLSRRLDRIYAGRPDAIPADRALAAVVAHFDLPRTLLDALLEGFAWDAEGRRYPDISSVYSYAARVAGSVGTMMAILMGARSQELAARACDLGVAMQLSNIARDVGEDARAGRLYLPEQWLLEEGIDPDAWLARPVFTPALGRVIGRLLRHADDLYAQADEGIADLPLACRPGINAARYLYAEIGREVERLGCNSVYRRAVVSGRRKTRLLPRIMRASALPRTGRSVAPLRETRFLVDATSLGCESVAGSGTPAVSTGGVGGRVIWVLELFERLEREERSRRAAPASGEKVVAALRY